VSDQVSHPYKTTGKNLVLRILIFIFLSSKLEDKKIPHLVIASTLRLQSALISSWMEFWFVRVFPKYLNWLVTIIPPVLLNIHPWPSVPYNVSNR
jgi:hypothetical protein